MRMKGFEPLQALSYESLNLARLTAPAHPLSSLNGMKTNSSILKLSLVYLNLSKKNEETVQVSVNPKIQGY